MDHRRRPVATKTRPKRHGKRYIVLLILLIVIGAGYYGWHHSDAKVVHQTITTKTTSPITKPTTTKTATVAATPNACASNTLSQLILVSISARHLWACDYNQQVYDSPVITGMEFLPADLTPTGTYHIYTKETDHTLIGCDSTGCWNDYVNYYMIFLNNQYGNYGFHDATWRTPAQFGNISPNSPDASHGCVECPLATAKWLYGWSVIGTTVTITS